jgi:DNA helicase-2/ATP-dependent DNA helicase PcrA
MNMVRHDLEQSKKESRFPQKDTCLSIYSLAVNSGVPLKQILPTQFPWCVEWEDELRTLFIAYCKAKRQQNVLDYDDLLLYWAKMLNDEDLAAEIGSRFDHILVDEYQDTNRLQAEILLKLKPQGRGVMVVGDDAQAIYSFRAATVRNILDFPDKFKPRARVVTLEQNYRSTQPILYASNLVIGFAKERYTKNLFSERPSQQKPYLTTVADEAAQARYVARRILKAREAGVPLKQQAVLFEHRTTVPSSKSSSLAAISRLSNMVGSSFSKPRTSKTWCVSCAGAKTQEIGSLGFGSCSSFQA